MIGSCAKTALITAGFCAVSGAAQAACPGVTQLEMNNCAAAEYQYADAQLNAIWAQAKPSADRLGVGVQLLDAQRLWISYRDAACAAEAGMVAGGSMQPQVWNMCMTRLTAQRSGDLLNFLN